ncbi:MAG: 2-amino-4-hydroxy-6-hydroxymethyldihydropteridine diphosphokinase [Gammaproteobacteria bacterium]
MKAQVYVSIGSNVERRKNIALVLEKLADEFGPIEQSSVYESDAVGFSSDPFYNLVVGFQTDVSPRDVQDRLHAIEDSCGRVRLGKLSARTMDLDLLLYADRVIHEQGLSLPRSDITRYAFVLCPLAEIAGMHKHPVSGERYSDMWAAFDDSEQALRRVDWPPVSNEAVDQVFRRSDK